MTNQTPKTIDAVSLRRMLGKKLDSVIDELLILDEEPYEDPDAYVDGSWFYLIFVNAGISICVKSAPQTIQHIDLCLRDGLSEYYSGELLFDLKLGMTTAFVEKKLGPPRRVHTIPSSSRWQLEWTYQLSDTEQCTLMFSEERLVSVQLALSLRAYQPPYTS